MLAGNRHIASWDVFHALARPVILLFTAFSTFVVSAQQLDFHSLADKIPLPASETYNIVQDSSGFIWFATEAGYCRYRKGKVEVFDKRGGIPEKAVYAAAVDERGVLYVATREHRILYFNGHSFVEAPFSAAYIKKTSGHVSYASALKFDGPRMYIYESGQTTVIDRITGQVFEYRQTDNVVNYLASGKTFLQEPCTGSLTALRTVEFNIDNRITRKVISHKAPFTGPCLIAAFGNKKVVWFYGTVWLFENGRLSQSAEFPNRILWMDFDQSGNLLIGFLNEGLHRYENGNLESRPLISLRGLSVSNILVAKDHSIWCTTLEDGVYFCSDPKLVSYQNVPGLGKRILLLSRCDGKLFCASNEVGVYDIGTNDAKLLLPFSGRERFLNIARADGGYLLSSAKTQLASPSGKRTVLKYGDLDLASYSAFGSGRTFIFSTNVTLMQVTPVSWPSTTEIEKFEKATARDAISIRDSLILVYGRDMLLVYQIHPLKQLARVYRKLDYTCALYATDGNVYLTTKSNGVYRYSLSRRSIERVNLPFGDNILLSIDQDAHGQYWLGTNTGVLMVDPSWTTAVDFGYRAGLPNSEVRFVRCFRDSVFFGTNEGLFAVPDNLDYSRQRIYPPRLDYYVNKGRQFTVPDPAGWFGDVTVKLLIPDSGNGSSVFYVLSDGSSSQPIHLEGDKITFSQLQPGAYKLSVYLRDKFGNRSRTLTYSFVIAAYFYQTWWFRVLLLGLFIFVVILVFSQTVKMIRKREARQTEINTRLAEFQMSALQAQMNPHFIFNAINTIQSYILTRNKDEAYRYLTKFSTLIRLVLHNSQEKFIPLVEELEVINTYLELEQARFSNFTYRIDIQPDIDIYETMIPAMLIQPYLENAIWHGLGHLTERTGSLHLSFSITDSHLQIEVRDNGIGRAAAAKNKRSSHKSVGTSITQQRLETLTQLSDGGVATVEIIDLTENGSPAGTLVIIHVSLPDHL